MPRALWLFLIIALIVAAAFVLPGIAFAQVSQQAVPKVTCSGNGCNNLDPIQTGCVAGAKTVQTAVLSTAFLQLRYSPTCKTNWGRVISRGSNNTDDNTDVYLVLVDRIDGLSYGTKGLVGPFAWSRMVFAPVARARACVSINGGNEICTAFV